MRKIWAPWTMAALLCALTLTGCTGVIDNCHEALNPPPGGGDHPH